MLLLKDVSLLGAALIAFAGNSVLCRLALTDEAMQPEAFTAVRIGSGAAVLAVVLWKFAPRKAAIFDPLAAAALLVYAECFAWAYRDLSAGAGAVLLFGAVQFTMTAFGLMRGEHLSWSAWFGIALASVGLLSFFVPVPAPASLSAAVAMIAAGAAWGVYSLRAGKRDALHATAWNFILAAPIAVALSWTAAAGGDVTDRGVIAAMLSGAITSGLGYVLWYRVVPVLTSVIAATAQLSVPLLAALGGAIVLGEALTASMALALALVLTGICLVNFGVRPRSERT